MKAVVTKINKNYAVVLKTDGTFVRVPNKSYVIGQEIYIKDNSNGKIASFVKKAAAATAVFIMILGVFSFAYNIPRSYVSIDINPSIEFSINSFGRVIDAKGVNDDGATVLEKTEIGHKSMERAIELVISEANTQGYFSPDKEKTVVIGIHCKDENEQQKVMENAKQQAEKSLVNLGISTSVSISSVNEQSIKDAQSMGTTAGKLKLIEEYLEITEDNQTSVDEMIEVPVQEIVQNIETIKENKDSQSTSNSSNGANIPDEDDDINTLDNPDDELDDYNINDENSSQDNAGSQNQNNGNANNNYQADKSANHADDTAIENKSNNDNSEVIDSDKDNIKDNGKDNDDDEKDDDAVSDNEKVDTEENGKHQKGKTNDDGDEKEEKGKKNNFN